MMHPKIASGILRWMNDVMSSRNISSARITFFGGEPLICYPVIEAVLQEADVLKCESLDINMSTNGYLLIASRIEQLYALGLRRLQLTIDGPPEIHDRRRPLASGRPTFPTITQNLMACLNHGIDIDLLTVVDDGNSGHLGQLVEILAQLIPDPRLRNRIQWSFTLVEPTEGCAGHCGQLLMGKERQLSKAVHAARVCASDAGFRVLFPYSSNVCARQLDYTFGIGPDGEIYPCFGVFGDQRYTIGNIVDHFEIVEQKSKEWARMDCFDQECVSCEVFPLCRGCRCQHMAAQVGGGSFGRKYCEKTFLIEDIRRSLLSSFALTE